MDLWLYSCDEKRGVEMREIIQVIFALFDIGYKEQVKLNEYNRGYQSYSQESIDKAQKLLIKIIYVYQTRLTDED